MQLKMLRHDTANTSTYGNPEITKVELGVRNNPAILISGHEYIKEAGVKDLLKELNFN